MEDWWLRKAGWYGRLVAKEGRRLRKAGSKGRLVDKEGQLREWRGCQLEGVYILQEGELRRISEDVYAGLLALVS